MTMAAKHQQRAEISKWRNGSINIRRRKKKASKGRQGLRDFSQARYHGA